MEHGQVAMLGDFIWPIIMQNNTSSLCLYLSVRHLEFMLIILFL